MFNSYSSRFVAVPALLALSVSLSNCSTEQQPVDSASPPAPLDVAAILTTAADAMGGRDALANLHGYSMHAERNYYMMGQGPEPGSGLMQLATASTTIRSQADRLRLDVLTLFADRDNSLLERKNTELVIGDAGYLHDDGFLGMLAKNQRPATPDRLAATKKTERLLNPHVILQELLANPAAVSVAGSDGDGAAAGRRFTSEEALPVTLARVRQTGKRTLIASEAWQRRSEGTDFYNQMVEKVEVDSNWLNDWHKVTGIDTAAHHRLVVEDPVFPITVFVHKQTGRLSKVSTMEWDVVYGDVPLEVNYDDWQTVGGVSFPSRVRMSFAGAPRIDSTRSEIVVNPEFAEDTFAVPEGVTYVHDEEVAQRALRLSQSTLGFGFAGVARPTIDVVDIRPGIHLLFASPIDGVYTFVVEQDNGIVVIEPGMNDLKGEEIIKWIGERYPDKPISHVSVSHFHNDHAAGIRPYIAAGATVVVHAAAVDFYENQASRPASKILPDALDRNPRPLEIIGVSADKPYRIEDGTRPVVIYPLTMGHVSDMVFAYVEGDDVLYSGDLYMGGLARDIRAGKQQPAPGILPFHAAVSLNDGIREYGLEGVAALISSHDRQPLVYKDLLTYLGQ